MGTFTLTLKEVLDLEGGNIGLNEYPIFDEEYRQGLNDKIIDHFWNQENGQETDSMFRLALRRKMNEIMPLYNQHYRLNLLEVDPLSTISIKSLSDNNANATNNETSSNNSGTTAKSRAIGSDFPQTMLMDNGDYASNGTDNVSDATATGSADTEQTSDQTAHSENNTTGYQGHAPVLILQARQALVNVDMMIIEELQPLFMLIWSTNDEYFGRNYPYYGLF
jgi:hypothetical protein